MVGWYGSSQPAPNGCSFAVAREGAVVYAGCAGTTPAVDGEGGLLPAGSPITTETIFITASVTKPLAGIAIMQLVEAGRLSLDAPLVSLLPAFAGGDKGLVTVRHLLCHTSGIPDSVAGVDRTTHPTLADHTAAGAPLPGIYALMKKKLCGMGCLEGCVVRRDALTRHLRSIELG